MLGKDVDKLKSIHRTYNTDIHVSSLHVARNVIALEVRVCHMCEGVTNLYLTEQGRSPVM